MTEKEIRALIVEALEYASVFTLRDKNLAQPFLLGRGDARMDELELDSLAVMELCIAIEVNTGVSVVPGEIVELDTLNQLVTTVMARASHDPAPAHRVADAGPKDGDRNGPAALYARLKRASRTTNELNKARVLMENRITPLDLEAMTAGEVDAMDHDWLGSLKAACAISGKQQAEPFRRKRLGRNIWLYETVGNKSGKTLTICYTGNAQRMMMPIPVFLQHLDGRKVDVLLLQDCSRSGYRKGIRGTGDDIESAIDKLASLPPISDYRGAVSIGISGGGIPAIITALRLKLDAALSVGGNNPLDPRWKEDSGVGADDILLRNLQESNEPPKVFYAFGSGSDIDMESAKALHSLLPTQLIKVGDDRNRVGHVALDPILRSGKLGEFLNSTVFQHVG